MVLMKAKWQKFIKILHFLSKNDYREIIIGDLTRKRYSQYSDESHLAKAMTWLCRAHDATYDHGVAAAYEPLARGWLPSYPETTGYIIPTFVKYASVYEQDSFKERALRLGDWEIDIQLPFGAVRGGVGSNSYPIVFNTGQVLLGWISLFRLSGETRFFDAAEKAATWLIKMQDDDGKWTKYTFNETAHAYHTRVAWPLLEFSEITGDDKYKIAAFKFIDWLFENIAANYWISHMGFQKNDQPTTHTIAYTLRGLFECSRFYSEAKKEKLNTLIDNVLVSISKWIRIDQSAQPYVSEMLPGVLDKDWNPVVGYSCITGNVQLAIVYLKRWQENQNFTFKRCGETLIEQAKSTQLLTSPNPDISGAIPGSYPSWGAYETLSFPNWATKFFADALMLKLELNL